MLLEDLLPCIVLNWRFCFVFIFSSNEPTLVSSTSNLHSRSSSPGGHHSGSSSSNHSSSQDLSKNLSNQDLRSSSTERVSRELPSLDQIQRQETPTGAQYSTPSTSPPPPVESNRSPPPPRSSSVTNDQPSVSIFKVSFNPATSYQILCLMDIIFCRESLLRIPLYEFSPFTLNEIKCAKFCLVNNNLCKIFYPH